MNKNLGVSSKDKRSSSTIGLKNDKDEVNFYCNFSVSDVDDFYEKKGASQNSFRLAVVTEDNTGKLLGSHKHKATGYDTLSARFLKDLQKAVERNFHWPYITRSPTL